MKHNLTLKLDETILKLLPEKLRQEKLSREFPAIVSEYLRELFGNLDGMVQSVSASAKELQVTWMENEQGQPVLKKIVDLLHRKEYPGAALLMEFFLAEHPNDIGILYDLGVAYSNMGIFHCSESLLMRLLELEPDNINGRVALGVVLARQQKTQQALMELKKAVSTDPKNPRARRILGKILMRDSNRDRFSNYDTAPSITGGLDEKHIVKFLIEHFRSANLQRQGSDEGDAPDTIIYSNRDFWLEILRDNRNNLRWAWVRLVNFQIVDWFPRTPGLYHTNHAEYSRLKAHEYITNEENGALFYDPDGKAHMLDGGIGAVRFKPVEIEGYESWLCTGTSDGFCHSGIPLAIPSRLMMQVEYSSQYTITGRVRYLPQFLEHYFYHTERVPQIYLLVDSIEKVGHSQEPIIITPMVFFTGQLGKLFEGCGNVTYVTCRANSFKELDRAADWLSEYAKRYRGEIITNFDEQRPIFKNAPFSLQNVMEGRLNTAQLLEFHIDQADIVCDTIHRIRTEAITMSRNEINIGDNATIYGDVVAANSIRNSFNKAASAETSDELKERLKELALAVEKMSVALPKESAQQAARDLETLVVEATSKSPRKEWWQLSVESLKKAAVNVGEIGKPVLELAGMIIALLMAKPS